MTKLKIKKFKAKDHYVRCTIYGGSGAGKTVFGGTAPKPIFASSEEGLLSVVSTLGYEPDYVEINSLEDLQNLYKHLKSEDHGYQTLVIDSLSEINEMIRNSIEKRSTKKMSFQEWGELFRKIKGILRGIKGLPMNVIVICQEKKNTDDDGKVESVQPMLNGKNATEIAYMMDIVGYIYIDKNGERHIRTGPSDKLLTKDRTGKIGDEAPLEFTERVELMKTIEVGEQEERTVELDEKEEEVPEAPDMITADQKKAIHTKFDQFWKLVVELRGDDKDEHGNLVYTKDNKEHGRKTMMKHYYKKDSSTKLTKEEAADFIKKIDDRIKKFTEEQEASNGKNLKDKMDQAAKKVSKKKSENKEHAPEKSDDPMMIEAKKRADNERKELKAAGVQVDDKQYQGMLDDHLKVIQKEAEAAAEQAEAEGNAEAEMQAQAEAEAQAQEDADAESEQNAGGPQS